MKLLWVRNISVLLYESKATSTKTYRGGQGGSNYLFCRQGREETCSTLGRAEVCWLQSWYRLLTITTLLCLPSSASVRRQLAIWCPSEDRRQASDQSSHSMQRFLFTRNDGNRLLLEFRVHGLVDGWWLSGSEFRIVQVLASLLEFSLMTEG